MFLKILKMVVYFFIIFAKPVYAADYFDTNQDSHESKYYQTAALGIDMLPSKNEIAYDSNTVLGSSTVDVLKDAKVEELVNFNNLSRKDGKYAEIQVPPESRVSIIYVYSNQVGKNVNISRISLMFTATDPAHGDWSRVLALSGTQEGSFTYKYIGVSKTKTGVYKTYPGLDIVSDQALGAIVLDTVVLKNPLTISAGLELKNLENDQVVLSIKNSEDVAQNGIKVKYMGEEQTVDIDAYQEKKVYFDTTDRTFDKTAQASIENPNPRKECIVNTTTDMGNTNVERNILFSSRDETSLMGIPSVSGVPSFCITQIPYTMFSGLVVDPDFDIQSVRGVEDISDGLKELPKTGKGSYSSYSLLVGTLLLCYAIYILRREYDCKNNNTRICTKSSENA